MKLRHWMSAMLIAAALTAPAHAAAIDAELDSGMFGRLLELLGLDLGMQKSSLPPVIVVVPPPPPPPLPPPFGSGNPPWWGACQIDIPQPICHQN